MIRICGLRQSHEHNLIDVARFRVLKNVLHSSSDKRVKSLRLLQQYLVVGHDDNRKEPTACIIAPCVPYRIHRTGTHHDSFTTAKSALFGTGIHDPTRLTVYRVIDDCRMCFQRDENNDAYEKTGQIDGIKHEEENELRNLKESRVLIWLCCRRARFTPSPFSVMVELCSFL